MPIDKHIFSAIKGFLTPVEGSCLYRLAREASLLGPCLEIGSYCGKTGAYLGQGCRENGAVLFSIDHHRGSEEQQPGQAFFDPDLLDKVTGLVDTFPFFRRTIRDLDLGHTIIPIVADSEDVSRGWATPLGLVLIDGGHTFEAALTDYSCWAPHILPGGYLVIHDIFTDPKDGGQAPRLIYELAKASGFFSSLPMVETLGILKRLPYDQERRCVYCASRTRSIAPR